MCPSAAGRVRGEEGACGGPQRHLDCIWTGGLTAYQDPCPTSIVLLLLYTEAFVLVSSFLLIKKHNLGFQHKDMHSYAFW